MSDSPRGAKLDFMASASQLMRFASDLDLDMATRDGEDVIRV